MILLASYTMSFSTQVTIRNKADAAELLSATLSFSPNKTTFEEAMETIQEQLRRDGRNRGFSHKIPNRSNSQITS